MDGRGIAMVDPVIILEVESNESAIVGAHGDALRADLLDGREGAVLHAKAALILQEHDAIPAGKVSRAAVDGQADVIAQLSRSPHPRSRRPV
jgi:hypothetical protein